MRASHGLLCVALYFGRMFFITAGFHRYFAHRSYKMGRVMQFVMAWGASTSCQKGVLWWAAHHRAHHRYSDTERDIHSPKKAFWWSHVGWILCPKHQATDWALIKDFARYPELVWLNRYNLVPGVTLGAACYLLAGWSGLWTFFLSTTLLYHGTFSINSLMHLWGTRRYVTADTSRNSFLLALITMGEGWHNNHHYYQSTANQVLADGRVAYRIKNPRGKQTHRVMSPIQFLARLCALIPPPRHPLVRFHGVFAPHSSWRRPSC